MEKKPRSKQRPSVYFSVKQKHKIIKAYLEGNKSKAAIWEEFTGEREEKGKLLKWMRQLGYIEATQPKKSPAFYMKNKPKTSKAVSLPAKSEMDQRIRQLEQELQDSHLREQSYILMIEIAERDLKVNIRKK